MICGDNIKTGNEQCDDGNKNDLDECTNECKLKVCGDGKISKGEQCEDGNTSNNDGCSSTC